MTKPYKERLSKATTIRVDNTKYDALMATGSERTFNWLTNKAIDEYLARRLEKEETPC